MPVVVHRNKMRAGSKEDPTMNATTHIFLVTPIILMIVGTPALIWLMRKY